MSSNTPRDKNKKKPVSKPSPEHAATASKATSRMFGKYQIQRKVGSGGMGSVYLAHDTELNRKVALKILPREKADNPVLLKRFKSEAQAAATLKDEHIVMVFEAGEIDGFYYIAMEYVEGIDVHRLIIRKEKISVKRSIEIVKQIALALDHISDRNIVHRDIKPSNLFIQSNGTVKLGDLGLARFMEESDQSGVTRDGTTVGTVDYIAPEQARDSRAADIRSDMYSLGCTWYHMLTGLPPFPEGSLTNKLHAHAVQAPPNPQDLNPSVPDGVVAVLHRMMAKKAVERYQTPRELIDDLEKTSLTRVEITDDVFDSLSVSTEEISAEAENKTVKNISVPAPAQPTAPPSGVWKPGKKASDEDDDFEVNIDPIKFVVFIIIVAGLIGGIIWLLLLFSHSLPDQNGFEIPDERKELLQGKKEEHQPGPRGKKKEAEQENSDDGSITFTNPSDDPIVNGIRSSFFARLPEDARKRLNDLSWIHLFEPSAYQSQQNGLKKFTVIPGDSDPTRSNLFRDISAAMKNAPNQGAIIELSENSIHEIDQIKLLPGQQIVLNGMGSKTSRPSLIIRPDNSSDSPFPMDQCSLMLTNINVIVIPRDSLSTDSPAIFKLDSGKLCLRNSSVTVVGGAPVTITKTDMSDSVNAVLIDQSVVRGDNITLFDDHSSYSEFAAVNSLLYSRNASPFILAPPSSAPGFNSKLYLMNSTAATQDAMIRLPQASNNPYHLVTNHALLGSLGPHGVLILSRPPIQSVQENQTAAGGTFPIMWDETDSLFAGWSPLIKSESPDIPPLDSISSWNDFWGQKVEEKQINETNLAEHLNQRFVPNETLVATNWGGAESENSPQIGVPLKYLESPGADETYEFLMEHLESTFDWEDTLKETDVVEIDFSDRATGLNKSRPFIRHITQKEWESGTTFILNGSGPVDLPPFTIDEKWCTIEVINTDPDNPMFFKPVRTNSASSVITVNNGELILKNFRLVARQEVNVEIPAHLIHVNQGNLKLDQCQLESNFKAGQKTVQSLILWTGETADESRQQMVIRDTFAYGANPVILSTVEQSSCEISNSSLVSRSNIIRQELLESHLSPHNIVLCQNSSFSANSAVFQIRNTRENSPAADSLQLGLFNIYLGPPFNRDDSIPARLLTYVGSEIERPFISVISENIASGLNVVPTFVTSDSPDSITGDSTLDEYSTLTGRDNPYFTNGASNLVTIPLKESHDYDFPHNPSPGLLEFDVASMSAEIDKSIEFGADAKSLEPKKKSSNKNKSSRWKKASPSKGKPRPQF